MKEIITGDGRIFRESGNGIFREQGGKRVEVSANQIKQYDKYADTKSMDLKDSARSNPHFTNLMWEKSKH